MIIISRYARKNIQTPFIHVMVQGVNKEYIFKKEEYIKRYLNIIWKTKEEYDFTMMAYCIMTNHAHFLAHTPNIEEFGKFMQKVNLKYSKMYNKEENRVGVLFRNRYESEPINDEKHLINCIKYIHNNPVRAKMVSSCGEYKYSSYNEYICNGDIIKSKVMKEIFGENCDFKKLFNATIERTFLDTSDEKKAFVNEYIKQGISEYKKIHKLNIEDVSENRDILKDVIQFLNEEYKIKYVDIKNFLGISRGKMESLKNKSVF